MLCTLRIKNLALVADLEVEFLPGFNAITGETGAGKSILIGALNLVLGERADRTLIRAGSDACSVEALFAVDRLRTTLGPFLEANGLEPCDGDQLVLKRTFTQAGTNRQWINGSLTTLQILAQLGEWLVDIHGPHDHQSLLHPARQLDLLDAYGDLQPLRGRFAEALHRRQGLVDDRARWIVDEITYARQLDLLRHQVREIDAARLQPDEEDALQQEYPRLHNAARLVELSQVALGQLAEEDQAALTQLGALGRTLQDLHRLDPQAESLAALQAQAASMLQDLQRALSQYADRLDLDPDRLQVVEQRLNLIQNLKRKYGASVAAVLDFGRQARQELDQLESREAELARIAAAIAAIDQELLALGRQLSDQRRQQIPRFVKAVTRQLADLGFAQHRFQVALEPLAVEAAADRPFPSPSGLDRVEYQFSPNPGEPLKALRAIASSGELARVMLGLKTVLAAQDQVPVLVFDEVDANVGGETAARVGEKLREIGRQRQVLGITHLAPVAACAAAHFVVHKDVQDGRTLTGVRALADTDRVPELARMLGGNSEVARRHARELLDHGRARS